MSGWISVDDRLPDHKNEDDDFLCHCNDIVYSWYEVLTWHDGWCIPKTGERYPAIVDRWMQIPEPIEFK